MRIFILKKLSGKAVTLLFAQGVRGDLVRLRSKFNQFEVFLDQADTTLMRNMSVKLFFKKISFRAVTLC